jgi:hypothetical protein
VQRLLSNTKCGTPQRVEQAATTLLLGIGGNFSQFIPQLIQVLPIGFAIGKTRTVVSAWADV